MTMRLNSVSYTAIEKAVSDVLATNRWPINQNYDDAGLSQRDYTKFVAEVITRIRHNADAPLSSRTSTTDKM